MTDIEEFLSQDVIIDSISHEDFEKVYTYAKNDLQSFEVGQLTQILLDSKLLSLDDITVIEFAMFCRSKLANIILPNSIQEISRSAFEGSDLSDITFSSNLTYIDSYAFAECYNLKQVILPDSVVEIGSNCFYRSGLEEIVVSKNIQKIGYGAFSSVHLKRVIFRSESDIDIDRTLTIFDRQTPEIIIPKNNTLLDQKLRRMGFSNIIYLVDKTSGDIDE